MVPVLWTHAESRARDGTGGSHRKSPEAGHWRHAATSPCAQGSMSTIRGRRYFPIHHEERLESRKAGGLKYQGPSPRVVHPPA